MRSALRFFGRIVQGMVAAFLVIVIACSVYLIAAERIAGVEHPTVFGYSTAVVMSGSMEPTLSVGDLIVNHVQEEYAVGDVITFDGGSSLVTHRIVGESEDGFITQGDANNASDSNAVASDAVVGKVVASVPLAGDAVVFLRSPVGLSMLIFAGFLILWLPHFLGESKGRSDEEGS